MKIVFSLLVVIVLLVGCKSDSSKANVELSMKTYAVVYDGQPEESYSFREQQHIIFDLTLTSKDSKTRSLKFNDSQIFDYEITHSNGDQVWYWSSDKGFSAVLTELIIYPQETQNLHSEEWVPIIDDESYLPAGDYKVRAWLVNGDGNTVEFDLEITPNS